MITAPAFSTLKANATRFAECFKSSSLVTSSILALDFRTTVIIGLSGKKCSGGGAGSGKAKAAGE
jgi:hypothetical protein